MNIGSGPRAALDRGRGQAEMSIAGIQAISDRGHLPYVILEFHIDSYENAPNRLRTVVLTCFEP